MPAGIEQPIPFTASQARNAHQHRLENMDDYPAVQNLEVLEQRQEGEILHMRRTVDLVSDAPEIIRKVAPKELFHIEEELSYDLSAGIERFIIFPPGRREKFTISGESRYEERDAHCVRIFDFEVFVDYMLLNPFRGQIEKMYQDGLEDDLVELVGILRAGNY